MADSHSTGLSVSGEGGHSVPVMMMMINFISVSSLLAVRVAAEAGARLST